MVCLGPNVFDTGVVLQGYVAESQENNALL